jgi:hypothetical protein
VANPHVGGSHVPQIGINADNADMETARARFKPGSIKNQLFHLCEEAGPPGLKVQRIIDLMQQRGLKDWSTISVPRNTVRSPIYRKVRGSRWLPSCSRRPPCILVS